MLVVVVAAVIGVAGSVIEDLTRNNTEARYLTLQRVPQTIDEIMAALGLVEWLLL